VLTSPLPPSTYLAELLDAARRFPRVGLVLIHPGTGKLHLLLGEDPNLADQIDTYLRMPCFPVAILGIGPGPDHVTVEPVREWQHEPWMPRYLLALGERVRRELAHVPDFEGGA
jgi:hypothetical protein